MGGKGLKPVLDVIGAMLSGVPTNIKFTHPFDKFRVILFATSGITLKDPKAKILIVVGGGYHAVSNMEEWIYIATSNGLTPPSRSSDGRIVIVSTSDLPTTDVTPYTTVVVDDPHVTLRHKRWVYINGVSGTETLTVERLTPEPKLRRNVISTPSCLFRGQMLAQVVNAFPDVRCVVYGISLSEQIDLQKKLWTYGIRTSTPNPKPETHRAELHDSDVRVVFYKNGGSTFKYHKFPNVILWTGTLTPPIITAHPHAIISVVEFEYTNAELQSVTKFLTTNRFADAIVAIQNHELTTKQRIKALDWSECKFHLHSHFIFSLFLICIFLGGFQTKKHFRCLV